MRRLVVGAALVAAVAVAAGASLWAVQSFLLRGGAGSPEAAAETLIESLRAQDPVAAASVMHPAEVRELPAFIADAVGRADELRLASGGTVPGLAIEVGDYELDVREEAPGVARVTARNPAFRVAYDGGAVAGTGSELANAEDVTDIDSAIDQEAMDDIDLFVMVVDDGDGWYVSPGMTALDYLHRYQAEDVGITDDPDYDAFSDDSAPSAGSPEPEDVPKDVAAAIERADTDDLIDQLPSDQARVVAPYADFLAAWLSAAGFTSGQFALDDVTLETADGNGGRRLLATSAEYTAGSEQTDVDYGDPGEERDPSDCITIVGIDNFCYSSDSPLGRRLIQSGLDRPTVIVRQVDDGWKLDPVATAVDWGRRALEAIDADLVQTTLRTTSGEPAVRIDPSSVVDVPFDQRGFAVVEVSTPAGQDYAIGVSTDEEDNDVLSSSDIELRVTGLDGMVIATTVDSDRRQVFRANGPTRVFVGGLANGYEAARLAVVPAAPVEVQVGAGLTAELRGELDDSGIALWRVVLPNGASSLDVSNDGSEASAAIWTKGTDGLLGNNVTGEEDLAPGTELIVVGTGSPRAPFAFDLTPSVRGFSDGTRSRQVIVASSSTTTERISLGSSSRTTTIDLTVQGSSWSASVESEDDYDSTSSFYSDSSTGSLSISDAGEADLELSCGSTSIRTSCIFDVTVS